MDPALVTRFGDARIPRYTSYPTAPHFRAPFTDRDLRAPRRGGGTGAALALPSHPLLRQPLLVLRLPHAGGQERRRHRCLRRGTGRRDRPGGGGAAAPRAHQPSALRRRHADPCRPRPLPPDHGKHRPRVRFRTRGRTCRRGGPPHPGYAHDRGAGGARRQSRQPRRAIARPPRAAGGQPGPDHGGDRGRHHILARCRRRPTASPGIRPPRAGWSEPATCPSASTTSR